ncbi:MAG: DoxX family protein [Saprospiraceae bacterium]|nr:DoxX family protein [Saprospiraceae bacterium]
MMEHKFLDSPDIGKLLLRVGVGLVLFLHGLGTVESGLGGTVEMVANNGFPGWLAYGTYIGEFVAPLLVLLGKWSRPAAFIMALNMLLTVVVAHRDIAFARNDFGGWQIELNALLMLGALAVAMLGAGRFSLSRGDGRWD